MHIHYAQNGQPPCEAVSWNIPFATHLWFILGQPPCEAVSWNILFRIILVLQLTVSLPVRLWVEIIFPVLSRKFSYRQPPCEAVSWNNPPILWYNLPECQPPCEAVSWNIPPVIILDRRKWSASLWGCELKYKCFCHNRHNTVSASLWGCELKCCKNCKWQ